VAPTATWQLALIIGNFWQFHHAQVFFFLDYDESQWTLDVPSDGPNAIEAKGGNEFNLKVKENDDPLLFYVHP
jgi:hypothetical protein